MIQLQDKDGTLYYSDEIVDDAGDCDTIVWPDYDEKNLRRALFDDRETGLFDCDVVLLPNGIHFEI